MNDLLIYKKDGVALSTKSKIQFNFTMENIHKYISTEIIADIKNREVDIFYIKDSLSSSYLELYGLLVAYHIRLSSELGDKRFLPIVILSDLDIYILNKITRLARIFFTKNIFIAPNTQESISRYNDKNLKALTQTEYREKFLNLVEIERPKDYTTNHDISNEWSIYKWADFLGVKTEAIEENKKKIAYLLYFKYLATKYLATKKSNIQKRVKLPRKIGKILYIDDNWSAGWSDIFESLFRDKSIEFQAIKENYKDKSYSDIELFVSKEIKEFNPDIVILDMRLNKQDNISKDALSGIKLLKVIKGINRGIQIIVLSASGKGKVLNEANKFYILGYIKKDSPEESVDTKDTVDKLVELIDIGLEKRYLKEIWNIKIDILNLKIFNQNLEKFNEIKSEIESIFDVLDGEMENRLRYAMLAIFKSIEIIITIYIEERNEYDKRYSYWIDSGYKIPEHSSNHYHNSIKNKIISILHIKLGILNIDTDIGELIDTRNDTIHPQRGKPNINKDKILKWFNILKQILIKIKI